MSRREEIKARWEAATPGPWFTELDGIMDETRSRIIVLTGEGDQDDADATAIASAPTDIAWLLNALEAAEYARDHARRQAGWQS